MLHETMIGANLRQDASHHARTRRYALRDIEFLSERGHRPVADDNLMLWRVCGGNWLDSEPTVTAIAVKLGYASSWLEEPDRGASGWRNGKVRDLNEPMGMSPCSQTPQIDLPSACQSVAADTQIEPHRQRIVNDCLKLGQNG